MSSAFQMLVQQHDLRIVLLAAFICALSSFTGIDLAERARWSWGLRRVLWVGFAAIAVGFGIWTTHFVAMLSYDPGFLVGYEPVGTALSLAIAVAFTGIGVFFASKGRPMVGGLIVGAGIAGMHYMGMSAVTVGGQMVWNHGIVAGSVIVGAAISAAAFVVGAGASRRRTRLGASLLLTLAICMLHFTAMVAVDMGACFSIVAADEGFNDIGLAAAIGSLLALMAAMMVRFMETRDERRAMLEESRLSELANVAVEGLLTSVGGRIIACNLSFRALTQFAPGAELTELFSDGALSQLRASPRDLIRTEVRDPQGNAIPVEAALRHVVQNGREVEVIALRDLRERLAAEAEGEQVLRTVLDSESRLRLLIQSVTDYAIYMLDAGGHVANWNAGAQRNKGYTAAEIVGQHFSCFFSEEDRLAGVPEHALAEALRVGKFESEGWRYRKDGTAFWASVLVEPVHDDDGIHIGFAKITHDNTRQREDAEKLAAMRRNLQLALQNMSQGLALFDEEERLVLINERLREILDLPEDVADMVLDDFARLLGKSAALASSSVHELHALHRNLWNERQGGELVQEMTDGRTVRMLHRPIPGGGWVSTFEDISERRRSEAQITHMARHDALTGLPNRASFSEHIAWALDGVDAQEGMRLAVLGIDLDRFKEINDHLGHSAGDVVLKTLSQRLTETLQGDEFISRFGGDEFAAYTIFRHDHELDAFVKRLDAAIRGRFQIEQNDVSVGASIGIAVWPHDGQTADKLISNADMAMYRAKAAVAENVCFYQAEMDEAARERRLLARDLWQAIDKDELHLNFQIQKSVSTGETTGYEVLLRWRHPERGMVSPADFIPIAEECGAILPIGEWVLRTACEEAAAWNSDIRIAVNLSPVQLGSLAFVDLLKDVLAETGLEPWRLELEVTESAIISDKTRALHMLRQIKELGVTIAIDDFGTGYSSLETLRAFPFDKIKLDRSFMREVETSKQSKAIIRAILALGRSLEVPVLAEGVETMAQLVILRNEGCDEAQGFFLGRPQALELLPEVTERVA